MSPCRTIWLVSQYEPAPGDTFRPLRGHYLAKALIARGYNVVQWSACFSHRTRNIVAQPWEERQISPGWTVRFVPNPAYEVNVSAKRLASEARFARNLWRRGRKEARPECIVVGEPPRIVGDAASKLGHFFHTPVISDVIDLWPEFFHRVLPRGMRRAGKTLFAALYAKRKSFWSRVDGLVAVSQSYHQHALRVAPALTRVPTACVYSSIEVELVQRLAQGHSEIIAKTLGEKPSGEIWVGYAGALGDSYEIPNVIRAAEKLKAIGAPIRFIVAGSGPYAPQIKAASETLGSNVTYLGILPATDLYPMLSRCDLGLLSYSIQTTVSIPDKFYDYAAIGLPIINSLQGEVKEIIERWSMGVTYAPGDVDALVSAVQELAIEPSRRSRMREGSLKAAESWNAPEQFEIFANLVESVMARCTKS